MPCPRIRQLPPELARRAVGAVTDACSPVPRAPQRRGIKSQGRALAVTPWTLLSRSSGPYVARGKEAGGRRCSVHVIVEAPGTTRRGLGIRRWPAADKSGGAPRCLDDEATWGCPPGTRGPWAKAAVEGTLGDCGGPRPWLRLVPPAVQVF